MLEPVAAANCTAFSPSMEVPGGRVKGGKRGREIPYTSIIPPTTMEKGGCVVPVLMCKRFS